MRLFIVFAFIVSYAIATETVQRPPDYIEERIAEKLKANIDATAAEVTRIREDVSNFQQGVQQQVSEAVNTLRQGAQNFKQGVEMKVSGAAAAVGQEVRGIQQGVQRQVSEAVDTVAQGAQNLRQGVERKISGAADVVGQELIEAGKSLQTHN